MCEGPLDEETSAQSFHEVLNQWRTGHRDDEKWNVHAAKPGTAFFFFFNKMNALK